MTKKAEAGKVVKDIWRAAHEKPTLTLFTLGPANTAKPASFTHLS